MAYQEKLQKEAGIGKGPIAGGGVSQNIEWSIGGLFQAISEHILEALTNPSLEYWPIYAMIVVTILIAYLLHTALDAKIEENIRLGKYGNEPEPAEYSQEDFFKDLDANGPYPRAMSALTSESLIKLRPLISKRAYGGFAKRK